MNVFLEAFTFEFEKQAQSFGTGRGGRRTTYNSPTFAHMAVYDKEPDIFLQGKTGFPQKLWKNSIPIDTHIDEKALERIEKIKGLELRASCEGHAPDRVSYVVVRPLSRSSDEAKKLTDRLNTQTGIHAKWDVGTGGQPRIVVAGKTWHGEKAWKNWWNKLPDKIQKAMETDK